MFTSHALDFTDASMHSLVDFYASQQLWVSSQLTRPATSSPSSTSTQVSPSTTVASLPLSRSSSVSITSKSRTFRRVTRRKFLHTRSNTPPPSWTRLLPSLRRSRTLLRSRPRVYIRTRVVATDRATRATMEPVPSEEPRGAQTSSESALLLLRYHSMIGEHMESCRRLQSMLNDARQRHE